MSVTEKGKPRIFYGYIVVIAGIIASIFMVGSFTSFAIFFKPMSSEFGWLRATTSAAASIAGLVMGVVTILTGRLTDKYGPKIVLIGSGLLMGTGHMLMSQAGSLWNLYIFHGLLIGSGMSASEIPIVATIARWFVKRRGMVTGITKVGAGVGMMVVPLLTSWLINNYDWRTAYFVIGIMTMVGIVSMGFLFKRDPADIGVLPDGASTTEENETPITSRYFSLNEALKTKQFWIFGAVWFSFMYCLQAVMVHIANHVTDLGFSAAIGASVVSVIGAFSILGRVGLASLSDTIGPKMAYLITFSLLATSMLLVQFAQEPWMFYIFAAFYGTAHGACFALLAPMIASLFGLQYIGSIMGIILFFGTFGSIISPTLAGKIFDATGNYQLAFWICLAISVIGVILIFLIKSTQPQQPQEE